jgi:hypothetical protein
MQSDRHARIKDRAYHIWVSEGRPHGKHDEHWHRAEREVAEEEGRTAKPAAARRATRSTAAPPAEAGTPAKAPPKKPRAKAR